MQFKHSILLFYHKGNSVTQMVNMICSVYGECAASEITMQKWFARFLADDFNVKIKNIRVGKD